MTSDQLPLDPHLRPQVPTAVGRPGFKVPAPGTECINDRGESHTVQAPTNDVELQAVSAWLSAQADLPQLIGDAIEDAIYYVLDGWRTHRFDLLDSSVDSDERRSLGTKLQYHVIENLGLEKLKHPDTAIAGYGVEIKGTIGETWQIPTEGQCGLTMMHRVDLREDRHKSWLMRPHRVWLRAGANKDGKRGISAQALADYSVELYDWTTLRPNPLKILSDAQRTFILGGAGQERRLITLFQALPEVVIPRAVILTVCANRDDPMRRVRATRQKMRDRGFALLCGQWVPQRQLAAMHGFDLTGSAWVAVPWNILSADHGLARTVLTQMTDDGIT